MHCPEKANTLVFQRNLKKYWYSHSLCTVPVETKFDPDDVTIDWEFSIFTILTDVATFRSSYLKAISMEGSWTLVTE